MRDRSLTFGVWVLVILGAVVWFLSDAEIGKSPVDESVQHQIERDLRTGQLFDVQVVRCTRCGQVVSWVRFNASGIPVGGYVNRAHDCGKVWGKRDAPKGAGFGQFNWLDAIDRWQKGLIIHDGRDLHGLRKEKH